MPPEQACAGAQIGCCDRRAAERSRTRDDGQIAVDGDIRAHARHFAGVQIAIFENGFADVRYAFGLCGERHELRLHVRGEAGIFLGGDVGGDELLRGAHAERAFPSQRISTPHSRSFSMTAPRWLGSQFVEQQFAAGDRARDQKSAGFDAIGNYGVSCAVQPFHALNAERGSAGAFDFCAHL